MNKLFKALFIDVLLQPSYLISGDFDSLSKGEIIPLSGVSKSGPGCIIHTGDTGSRLFLTCSVELQSALVMEKSLFAEFNTVCGAIQHAKVFPDS